MLKALVVRPAILAFLLLSSCSKDDPALIVTDPDTPNILLIIADDLGKDAMEGYAEGSIKPNTPNIDGLRFNGLTFNNLWVHPTCSPTRAAIITGKYGYRTGVKQAGDVLPATEVTLQKYLSDNTDHKYASALIGKWHLSGNSANVNPESFGIDYYAGLIRGAVEDYYQWQLSEDGAVSLQREYITETLTDLSINWINDQTEPWFLWLAYNTPHTPFHVPPANMHSQGDLPAYEDGMDPTPYFMAAIEAMDYQIGRLLENISDEARANTVIIFIGDNGTPGQVAQAPYAANTAKGTLFQGGVNVPMFIAGKGVTRTGADDHLLTGTDLFATIAEIAGIGVAQIHDSRSFKSLLTQSSDLRSYQYSEINNDNSDSWTIRNSRFKLIVEANGGEALYDLVNDPYEQVDLLDGTLAADAANAKLELEAELLNIRNLPGSDQT